MTFPAFPGPSRFLLLPSFFPPSPILLFVVPDLFAGSYKFPQIQNKSMISRKKKGERKKERKKKERKKKERKLKRGCKKK